jgi:hypothetical protein
VPDRVFAILQIVFTSPAIVQKQSGIITGILEPAADAPVDAGHVHPDKVIPVLHLCKKSGGAL